MLARRGIHSLFGSVFRLSCCRPPREITEFSTCLHGTKGVLRNGLWPQLNMTRPKIVNLEIASFLLILSKFFSVRNKGTLADILKDEKKKKKTGM